MRSIGQYNAGIAFVLVAIFLAIIPFPFLSEASSNSIADRIVRVGQALARAQLIDASNLPVRKTSSVYKIENLPYELEAIRNLPYDELAAIDSALKEQRVTTKFSSASRVLFEGWEPSILPIRIPYRYFLLLSAIFFIAGFYLLLRRQQKGTESGK